MVQSPQGIPPGPPRPQGPHAFGVKFLTERSYDTIYERNIQEISRNDPKVISVISVILSERHA